MRSDAPECSVDQMDNRARCTPGVLVVEARPAMHSWRYQGMSAPASRRVLDDGVDTGPESRSSSRRRCPRSPAGTASGRSAFAHVGHHAVRGSAGRCPSSRRGRGSSSAKPPVCGGMAKLAAPRCLPARVSRVAKPLRGRSPGLLRQRRWTTGCAGTRKSLAGVSRQVRDALDGRRPGPDDAPHPLVDRGPTMGAPRGLPPGVGVDSSAWCGKLWPSKVSMPGMPEAWGRCSGPVPMVTKAGPQLIAPVRCGRNPARGTRIPTRGRFTSSEKRACS